tara:strand:+ start:170 stop:394 length:225 start_codon:yes stop_codon:yes gene_type:complete
MTLSRKDFILLAEELAQSKLYYKSPISYNEQLERLTAYCIKSNPRFDKTRFIAFIDKTYKNLVKELDKKIGGSI